MGQSQSDGASTSKADDMPDLIEAKPTPATETKTKTKPEPEQKEQETAPAPEPAPECKKCPQQKAKLNMVRISAALRAIQTCEAVTVEECRCRQNAQLAERLIKGMCAKCPAAATCPALK